MIDGSLTGITSIILVEKLDELHVCPNVDKTTTESKTNSFLEVRTMLFNLQLLCELKWTDEQCTVYSKKVWKAEKLVVELFKFFLRATDFGVEKFQNTILVEILWYIYR